MPDTTGVKVLVYHWVDHQPGQKLRAWGLTPDAFLAQMTALAERGYEILSLADMLQVVRGERPASPKAVALTFDDGYQDLLDHVLPVLERFGFRATFFLVSDRVGGTNSWDARHGDPPRRLMGWSEAAALVARGMEIGSHSRTHPFLTTLSESEMEKEIRGSKDVIEDSGAFSTRFGGNGVRTDPFQLHRSEITYYDSALTFSFKVRTGFGIRAWTAASLNELLPRFVTGARGVAS